MTRADLHQIVDDLPDDAIDGASLLLGCIVEGRIDPDQAWFWTPEWQHGEREADADISAARGRVYYSDQEFLAALGERL